MKKKLLSLVACICILPLTAHAKLQSITFNLLNDSASVTHPITVTVSNLQYYSCVDSHPQLITQPLAPIADIGVFSPTTISVPNVSDIAACVEGNPNALVSVVLHVTQVDGKNKQGDRPYCEIYIGISSTSVNPQATLDIRETKDSFNCSELQLKQ